LQILPLIRSKYKFGAIAIITLFALTAVIAFNPAGATPYTPFQNRPTGTFVGASPSVVGPTQQVLINILVFPAPSGPTWYAQDEPVLEFGYSNISCTITAPDGTKSTFMPIDMTLASLGENVPGMGESVGTLEFYYTPSQTGNYSVTASFPGQTFTDKVLGLNDTVYYMPSTAANVATFTATNTTVLGGLLNGYPWSPLPTGYWTTPVSTNNREWTAISGDWVRATFDYYKTDYNPYSTAPTSPHILWAQQVNMGGIVGGIFGTYGYGNTAGGGGNTAITSLIINGKLYQQEPIGNNFTCIDLYTGQTLWTQQGILSQAQEMKPFYQTAAQSQEGGVEAWLWDFTSTAGVWRVFDTQTGNGYPTTTSYFSNAPSGGTITVYMQNDNPIVYVLRYGGWNTTIPNKFAYENIMCWNETKVISASDVSNGAFGQPTVSTNWLTGLMWNVSIRQPDGSGIGDGRTTVVLWPFTGLNVILATANNDEGFYFAFDATTGKFLYNATTIVPLSEDSGGPNGPYIVFDGATASWVAYNPSNGAVMWHYQNGQLPWADLPQSAQATIGGYWYAGSPDGHMYQVNMQTGAVGWTSPYTGATDETIYGQQPLNGGCVAADGQIYANTATVYGLQPKTRFHSLYDINATDGSFLWNLPLGPITPESIADGYLIGADGENGIEYCIGQGASTTTVTAQQQVGGSVLIQGSVMDSSPGKLAVGGGSPLNVPTPAISDANMSVWMDYLYGQNATLINNPPQCNGVPVTLTAVGPDGSVTNIGTTTSNYQGHFGFQWTPTTQGLYTIYATFAGSNSYWASSASTSATYSTVSTSTTTTAAPSTTTAAQSSVSNSDLMTYLIVGVIAIIVAIAIATVLIIRRKP